MLFFCALSILHSSLISNTVFVVCSFIFYFNSTKLREIVNFSHWNDWKQWKQSNKYTLRNVNTENTDSGRVECVWERHIFYLRCCAAWKCSYLLISVAKFIFARYVEDGRGVLYFWLLFNACHVSRNLEPHCFWLLSPYFTITSGPRSPLLSGVIRFYRLRLR